MKVIIAAGERLPVTVTKRATKADPDESRPWFRVLEGRSRTAKENARHLKFCIVEHPEAHFQMGEDGAEFTFHLGSDRILKSNGDILTRNRRIALTVKKTGHLRGTPARKRTRSEFSHRDDEVCQSKQLLIRNEMCPAGQRISAHHDS
jgi:hypothetical protein